MYCVQLYLSLNNIPVPLHVICYHCFSLQMWTVGQQICVYVYLCIQMSVYLCLCVCVYVYSCSAQGYIHGSSIAELKRMAI